MIKTGTAQEAKLLFKKNLCIDAVATLELTYESHLLLFSFSSKESNEVYSCSLAMN